MVGLGVGGSKMEIFKNVWEYFSSVGGSKIFIFSRFLDLGQKSKSILNTRHCAAVNKTNPIFVCPGRLPHTSIESFFPQFPRIFSRTAWLKHVFAHTVVSENNPATFV